MRLITRRRAALVLVITTLALPALSGELPADQQLHFEIPSSPSQGQEVQIKWSRDVPPDRRVLFVLYLVANPFDVPEPLANNIEVWIVPSQRDGSVTIIFPEPGPYVIQCNIFGRNGDGCGTSSGVIVLPALQGPTSVILTSRSSAQSTSTIATSEDTLARPTSMVSPLSPAPSSPTIVTSEGSSIPTEYSDSHNAATSSDVRASDKPPGTIEQLARSSSEPGPSNSAEPPAATTASNIARSRGDPGMIAGITLGVFALFVLLGWIIARKWRRARLRSEVVDPFLDDSAAVTSSQGEYQRRMRSWMIPRQDRKVADEPDGNTQRFSLTPNPDDLVALFPYTGEVSETVSRQPPMMPTGMSTTPSPVCCAHCMNDRSENPRVLGSDSFGILPSYEQACAGEHAASK